MTCEPNSDKDRQIDEMGRSMGFAGVKRVRVYISTLIAVASDGPKGTVEITLRAVEALAGLKPSI